MQADTLNSYNQYAKDFFADPNLKSVHKYIEKPAMYALIPEIIGKRVLCVGCGSGEECFEMYKRGATEIVGIDLSYAMLEEAKKKYGYINEIKWLNGNFLDLEELTIGKFDLIYSSLTLHYEDNLEKSLKKLASLQANNSTLLFSTNHPLRSSFESLSISQNYIRGIGTITSGNITKSFGSYFKKEKNETWLMGKFKYNYYHFTFSEVFNACKCADYNIVEILEPRPTENADNDFKAKYSIYTPVIIYKLTPLREI